mmetsp:Transcript_53260/g.127062  ORF Transcript_53260/g.127062 Transcript_53260/m.127062 type:complete len:80 (+) Transcript_53260:336-575(+)
MSRIYFRRQCPAAPSARKRVWQGRLISRQSPHPVGRGDALEGMPEADIEDLLTQAFKKKYCDDSMKSRLRRRPVVPLPL